MDDDRAHFIGLVESVCFAAVTGGLVVVIETESGRRLTGVPQAAPGPGRRLGTGGEEERLLVGGIDLPLSTVVACTVRAPGSG